MVAFFRFREVLGPNIYLCGHLHNLLGLGRRMYTKHHSGLLELELADWKDNRNFRIMAFDQGYFSFADAKFLQDSPNTVILVTNPKNPLFITEDESVRDLRRTTHVRVLVFSDAKIEAVELSLGDSGDYKPMSRPDADKPLYTLPWTPSEYLSGLHHMDVRVTLLDGSLVHHRQPFSLDGSQPQFARFPSFVLMVDWLPLIEIVFATLALSLTMLLVTFRILHCCKLQSNNSKIRFSKKLPWAAQFLLRQVRKIWILCALDGFFWPLVGFVIYTAFFPWSIAQVMTNRLGVIFIWGIIFLEDYTYCPPDMTFGYGIISLAFFLAPLILVLANSASEAYLASHVDPDRKALSEPSCLSRLCCFPCRHFGIIVIVLLAAFNARELACSYGLICALSPWGVGRIVFALLLYKSSRNLSCSEFNEVVQIWPLN